MATSCYKDVRNSSKKGNFSVAGQNIEERRLGRVHWNYKRKAQSKGLKRGERVNWFIDLLA